MKKLVNGKTVEISNIDIIIKSIEGILLDRKLNNSIDIKHFKVGSSLYNIIEKYNKFFSAIPYPLYGLDSDIKYLFIGKYIQENIDVYSITVADGLKIVVNEDDTTQIHLLNKYWCYEEIEEPGVSKSIDTEIMYTYYGCNGFYDFKWIYDRLCREEDTIKYYEEFMPEFYRACCNNKHVLKWELSNLLEFGNVPKDKMEIHRNEIINTNDGTIDIVNFYKDKKVIRDKHYSIGIGTASGIQKCARKEIEVCRYRVYKKDGNNKLIDNEDTLLLDLCNSIKQEDISIFNKNIRGIRIKDTVVIQQDNTIKIYNACEFKSIASKSEIYNVDINKGIVYIIKYVNIGNSINKKIIYGYDINKGLTRLCCIRFEYA